MTRSRSAALWLFIVAAALLAIGALEQRADFLRRGIPQQLPRPISDNAKHFGVNVRLDQYTADELEASLDAIVARRIRWIKQPFFFSSRFDWQQAERIMAAAAARDLHIVPLLDGDPAASFAPPNDLDAFAAWTGEFAQRFGEQVDYYIIWDEPNLASHWGNQKVNPDAYAALLNVAAVAIDANDAVAKIVAAPLAPTVERENSLNLSDPIYLQRLYEAAAPFDIAAAKPYGFDHAALDRKVAIDHLNFSRAILLREVMVANGDSDKALWAGNWGWNALPSGWSGSDSIWGQVSLNEQARYSRQALERALIEWPWMGAMFIENWEPDAAANDPIWGFSIAQRPIGPLDLPGDRVYPGFHFPAPDAVGQQYYGGWRFSPGFGADSSEKYPEQGQTLDSATLRFWGNSVGVLVRRADFRARYYVRVDDQSANRRPHDEVGSHIVLDAPNPNQDYLSMELIAADLASDAHTLEMIAFRGWDQWALKGYSVGYWPPLVSDWLLPLLWGLTLIAALLFVRDLRAVLVAQQPSRWRRLMRRFRRLSRPLQLTLVAALASLAAATGWLSWWQSLYGPYRRLTDGSQLAATLGLATIFIVSPSFIIYLTALLLLLLLISFRPAWGIALITLCIPLYARASIYDLQIHKLIVEPYRFSPTEIFTLLTAAALALRWIFDRSELRRPRLQRGDWAVVSLLIVATLSLPFSERLDVASNEWRWIIIEPALFYAFWRTVRLRAAEVQIIVGAFICSGLIVALFGLAQLTFGFQDLITAEAGLRRIQSFYGSPNNVALYLGRILPFCIAPALFNAKLRWFYLGATLICGVTFVLTFSKGGLLIGMPVALLTLAAFWLSSRGRAVALWLLLLISGYAAAVVLLLQLPAIGQRLNLLGATSFVRLNLWRASVEMVREHPLFGVGLDNFLYAHRGRYILQNAWREPDLNHPHNLFFDFATRLGIAGLGAGIWLFALLGARITRLSRQLQQLPASDRPLAAALAAAFGYAVAHGLVDHSFFLIDMAFSFYLLLGLAAWLLEQRVPTSP